MSIEDNLSQIKNSLTEDCKLIAVSKTYPPVAILEAYNAGQRMFGENKVQELISKYESLPKDIAWHMIGHLQTNKAKYIVPFVHLIHGVDSIKLLFEINKQAAKIDRVVSCLLQIHIAEEETKFGFSLEEVRSWIASTEATLLTHVHIKGLMGMATFTDNQDQIRREFHVLKMLFEEIKSMTLPQHIVMEELSMGMSGDYTIAMEEGSTLVRIGSAIFGKREYSRH